MVLADLVRLDRAAHRPVAGDSDLAEAVELLAPAHQTAVWERTRHLLRLRLGLRTLSPGPPLLALLLKSLCLSARFLAPPLGHVVS